MKRFFFLALLLLGLARAVAAGEISLVPVEPQDAPHFADDGDLPALRKSVAASLAYYETQPPETTFIFGKLTVTAPQMVETMRDLSGYLASVDTTQRLDQWIRGHFQIYRSTASGNVTFSSYHEATLSARLAPDAEYRYPIYRRPPDLVDVYLENFDPKKKGERIAGRVDGPNLVPYYTRKEIDSDGVLKGKNLEVAWAKDPLDISFLQIQGSGWLEAPGSTEAYHIRYTGDNGRPFRSVGLYLIESEAIRKAEFSRAKMVAYLSKLSEAGRQAVLNQNPRYIFFAVESSTNLTRGSLLVPLTKERSVASDPRIYPPGALAWISTLRPIADRAGKLKGTQPLQRFVLNQDEGGAIKGPGRIDFFAGGGHSAEWMAQHLWYPGELYFFVKRFPAR